ncbi:MAG TPA: hypothetical protein VNL38_00720 [Candidatus Nitrosotenuis sp.]|nr:hypothetical protein [Candidatus Nitrosotenuis sp.]
MRKLRMICGAALACVALLWPCTAAAQKIPAPAEAKRGIQLLYVGDTDAAIAEFRKVQASEPENPLGFLLEANAMWWAFYCNACERKWDTIDAWKRGKLPEDERYFALCDKGVSLAEAQLAKKNSALMQFYAGMGHGLRARLHGLRMEARATARAGVKGREHLLRAVELDPGFSDALAGIGLYNFYVETLSTFVKVLRWLMGIPGGNKAEGIRQLERAMREGEMTSIEARIYLAKNLRNYEQQYERAAELMKPLTEQFPNNGIFHLLLGDMYAKLGRREPATASFLAAKNAKLPNAACAARVRALADEALQALAASGGKRRKSDE